MIFNKPRGLQEMTKDEQSAFEEVLGIRVSSVVPSSDLERMITKLEAAAELNPSSWVFQYWLTDFYSRNRRYVDAIASADRLLEMAPLDPRSSYSAGSTYRLLTHAVWEEPKFKPHFPMMQAQLRAMGMDPGAIDPLTSKNALESLNMALDAAYDRTQALFEQTQRHRLAKGDKKMVAETIASIRMERE
ncbi:MAG TPA: hypothetical protein PK593_09065 [Thermomicrobiales bacterium]|jgi:tetratricopeptide (TPR) repeat protein|nr:hypothetical protein [Thermomicrobiales bacterium]